MRILAALFMSLLFALPATSRVSAHEFWIEPLSYQIAPEGMVQAELVNGQLFAGSKLAFLPQRFTRFTMASGMRRSDVENRIGARPALDTAPLTDGLHVFAYASQMATLGYSEWEKFLAFAAHKDFQNIEALHDARGLPRQGFSEGYWRYAKSLIAVGSGAGRDFRQGLTVEYVALDNPYVDDLSGGMRVQLYYNDGVVADGQVELFEKSANGTVEVTLHRTDADGIAVLPVKPGFRYLVDHVVLREPTAEVAARSNIVWETHWASLTFAVP